LEKIKVERKCGKKQETNKFMKEKIKKKGVLYYMSYVWAVILNLFILFIILAIFDEAYSSFETIVFSLLILIYLTLSQFITSYSIVKTREIIEWHTRFQSIKTLLGEKLSMEEMVEKEWEEEDISKTKNNLSKAQIKLLIGSIFNFIIFVIVLFNLLGAL